MLERCPQRLSALRVLQVEQQLREQPRQFLSLAPIEFGDDPRFHAHVLREDSRDERLALGDSLTIRLRRSSSEASRTIKPRFSRRRSRSVKPPDEIIIVSNNSVGRSA